jgi:exodeoxyribonuclease-3
VGEKMPGYKNVRRVICPRFRGRRNVSGCWTLARAQLEGEHVKIATFNVNGINGRLPVLLRWLNQCEPDVVCLQELKAPNEKFPEHALEKAGYGSIWNGQKSWNGVAILARDMVPIETRRGLPGDEKDSQSRYIEAAIDGILIGCLYLPNGNPVPGAKFDYKLRWFERLSSYAAELLSLDVPVVLAGDYNVMPTIWTCMRPSDGEMTRFFVRKSERRFMS